jgi:hypothetical protein
MMTASTLHQVELRSKMRSNVYWKISVLSRVCRSAPRNHEMAPTA